MTRKAGRAVGQARFVQKVAAGAVLDLDQVEDAVVVAVWVTEVRDPVPVRVPDAAMPVRGPLPGRGIH